LVKIRYPVVGAMLAMWLIYACRAVPPDASRQSPAALAVADTTTAAVTYRVNSTPQAQVHVLRVPPDASFVVTPAVAATTATLTEFVATNGAIAAVNGGFFDPVNQQTTSYITLQNQLVADPAQNDRLVGNPEMQPYLEQILDRSEFRRYQCDQTVQYDITPHSAAIPAGCQLIDALGAGPSLLPDLRLVEEGFADVVNGEKVRDALGSDRPNARTAVGILPSGEIVLVMAAQIPDIPDSGLSLPALAEVMAGLGAAKALNLDGGSSSTLYYAGQTVYGKINEAGTHVQRPVKSALLVAE
jgi:exopolysaccharide biosynthesis protein